MTSAVLSNIKRRKPSELIPHAGFVGVWGATRDISKNQNPNPTDTATRQFQIVFFYITHLFLFTILGANTLKSNKQTNKLANR